MAMLLRSGSIVLERKISGGRVEAAGRVAVERMRAVRRVVIAGGL